MPMSKSAREAFLAAPRVAVLSIPRPDRGPLSSPVWYDYVPDEGNGRLWFLTQRHYRKGKLLHEGLRITLTVQVDVRPYAYVSVEGAISAISAYDYEADLLPMAVRYLGVEAGREYVDAAMRAPGDRPAESRMKVEVTPEEWFSVDYDAG